MIPVSEAYEIVMAHTMETRVHPVDLKKASGLILRENVSADRDFPPFNRVMMDGIAICYNTFKKGTEEFPVHSMQPAGAPPMAVENPEQCVEVMTGAVIPDGLDTVVPYEEIDFEKKGRSRKATLKNKKIKKGQNVHLKGSDNKSGDLLIEEGRIIGPAEIQVLATVGESIVAVPEMPITAVISTGDELVDLDDDPKPHQIRKSNVYAIQSALIKNGIESKSYHLPDEKTKVLSMLEKILDKNQLVILTGGVSKGKKDYVPGALDELGVKKLFHRVRQRPGKPFWFGIKEDDTYVFALPGNPVSAFMCYYKYIVPWIIKSGKGILEDEQAILNQGFKFDPELTYFLPVQLQKKKAALYATPMAGSGSADLVNLIGADGFLELPEYKKTFKRGDLYPLIRYR